MSYRLEVHGGVAVEAPLYLRLMQQLLDEVRQGRWPTGLPSERKLSRRLAVSRNTARRALDLLCQRGMLERRRGSGTYLRQTPPPEFAPPPPSTRLALPAGALAPERHWLAREVAPASPEELFALGLSPQARVARLQWREHSAAEGWLALESRCLALAHLPRPQDFEGCFEAWLQGRGLSPSRELQRLRACNATPEQARLLGLPPGEALLLVRRQSYGPQGQALVLSQSLRLANRDGLVLELS